MDNKIETIEFKLSDHFGGVAIRHRLAVMKENSERVQVLKESFEKNLPKYISLGEVTGNEFKISLNLTHPIDVEALKSSNDTLVFPKDDFIKKVEKKISIHGFDSNGPYVNFEIPNIKNGAHLLPSVFNERAKIYRGMSAARVLANTLNSILKTSINPVQYGGAEFSELSVGIRSLKGHVDDKKIDDFTACCGEILSDYEGLLFSYKEPARFVKLFHSSAELHARNVSEKLMAPVIAKYGFDI